MGLPQAASLGVTKTMANPAEGAESGSGTGEDVRSPGYGRDCGEAMPEEASVAGSVREPRDMSGKAVPNRELPLEVTPIVRPYRLCITPTIRRLVAETRWQLCQLVMPVLVCDGIAAPVEIPSMPGQYQHTPESLAELGRRAVDAEIGGMIVFGVSHDGDKDFTGPPTWDPAEIQNRGLEALAKAVGDDLVITADNCLDETTAHGHCRPLRQDGTVDNDRAASCYAAAVVSQARARAWMVAPPGVIDGQVGAVRAALDEAGLTDAAIMAYSAKYVSGLFGPFRDTVGCPLQGDHRACQQNLVSHREGRREVLLDLDEDVDIVMVKPTDFYLDVLVDVAAESPVPVVIYQVSGEYSMIKAAAVRGWIDWARAIDESLTSIACIGAGIVLTYCVLEAVEGSA